MTTTTTDVISISLIVKFSKIQQSCSHVVIIVISVVICSWLNPNSCWWVRSFNNQQELTVINNQWLAKVMMTCEVSEALISGFREWVQGYCFIMVAVVLVDNCYQ